MATIRVHCDACNEHVDLGPSAIALFVDDVTERGDYSFSCPACGSSVTKDADHRIIGLLVKAGVENRSKPKPYPELIDDPHLPPITLDDLIDFHEELERLTAP